MWNASLVGVGGFIGSICRYWLSGIVHDWMKPVFPAGTLVVNLIGCLVIGVLSHLVENRGAFSAETRTFLFVGILGGFTTFSSFANESLNLWRDGSSGLASINIAAHIVLGLGAVWLGRLGAELVWG